MSYKFDYTKYKPELISILNEVDEEEQLTWKKFRQILGRYPKDGNKMFSKTNLVVGYKALLKEGSEYIPHDDSILAKIQMKPVRTQSGVTTVTVLTKPFPCPGKCIFCPNDIRMPKSYLADEPGAQRAERNKFDPYLQTYRRLQALRNIGHPTQKVELIILGGTWSYYPEPYQIWFIKRCFEALNDFGDGIDNTNETEERAQNLEFKQDDFDAKKIRSESYNKVISKISRRSNMKLFDKSETAQWDELFSEHERNVHNKCRNVGLVIETRPDNISPEEVIRIRKLGCTKTQIGLQSLQDNVLEKNKRGHDVQASIEAIKLLRQAGLKIHAHWMANLYGSTLEQDITDYHKLFEDPAFRPDELKIYPCSLIETADLMDYYERGEWKPYNHDQMLTLLTETIKATPEYCRLTRVVREFSSDDIVDGNTTSNFRQIAEQTIDKAGDARLDIRSREIKHEKIDPEELSLSIITYETLVGREKFLQYITKSNKIVGFLRLSLPQNPNNTSPIDTHSFIPELSGAAVIREIHVYGNAVNLGKKKDGKAQHSGLGTKLIEKAKELSKEAGYKKLAVISAIGTREYYKGRGFSTDGLYQSLVI
ncbi:tRNA uridine(34) 5-carboxymethylaminomethyl modification radical SAM/GNAT enzyme Elp3 [Candidatus Dojkabacteria bacterium]|uniref:tRNA carboxymethyluridine synthase n=1 Tax=Candidatus Dojkabacteria bacterium TaxID=2099670 RepID=A0A955L7W9_9BACT|nr:tRNA uridine(34) 5-carboxymethylaminomethyl modification radical SAM/GNAT enzyme Elp3 [Candidatus Dojkabacteria bacterium]